MSDQPSYLPRPGDLTREKLIALANDTIAANGGPDRCRVFFKFTCIYCGTRCTMVDANTLYETAECANCKKVNQIICGGIRLELKMKET